MILLRIHFIFLKFLLELLRGYNVTVWPHMTPIPREELLKEIVGKDALYCVITDKIDAEVLNKGNEIRFWIF